MVITDSEDRRARESTRHYEVVVAGGGRAGISLAIAAAREGVRVALVHDRPVLGGNSSSEVRVVPIGAGRHSAWAREVGIIEEILLEDRAHNHQQFYENGLTNSLYDLSLLDIVNRQPGLDIYLNTTIAHADVVAEVDGSKRIRQITGHQLTTGRTLNFSAAAFADCTGDGHLGYLAGADAAYGREGRAEYDEPLAPLQPDDVTSGATIALRARDTGRPAPFVVRGAFEPYRSEEDIGQSRLLRHIDEDDFGGFWWLEVGHPYHQIWDTEDVRDELLKHVLGVWNLLKNHHPDRDRLTNHALDWVGMLPGKRESRRLLGDVVISEADCHNDRGWPDRVSTAGWYLDLHVKGGILNKGAPGEPSFIDSRYRAWTRVAPFTVPLRACYSRNVSNLWLGGRCLSATHVALGSLRVQQTLAALGQAVGVAAAVAHQAGATPRQVAAPGGRLLAQVQERIMQRDVRVLGLRRPPLAMATATATSQATLSFGEPRPDGETLDVPRAQIVPMSSAHLDRVQLCLENLRDVPEAVELRVERVPTLWWDTDGERLASTSVVLEAGHVGWADFGLGLGIEGPCLLRLSLRASAGVRWRFATVVPTGTVRQSLFSSPGGADEGNQDLAMFGHEELALPAFSKWLQDRRRSYACSMSPPQRPYAADSVLTGVDYPEAAPNLWISDPEQPLPQAITVEFPRQVVSTVELLFDTGLSAIISRAPAYWRAPEAVADYSLSVRVGPDGWETVYERSGNFHRRNLVRLPRPSVETDALRLTVTALARPVAPPTRAQFARWGADGELYEDLSHEHASARVYGIHINPDCEQFPALDDQGGH